MKQGLLRGSVVLGLVLALMGCQGNTRDESEANVFILVTIPEGESVNVVANAQERTCSDVLQLEFENRLVGGGTAASSFLDVIITSLCVTYFNRDTQGNVEMVDIPRSYCLPLEALVPVGGTYALGNFPVLTPWQKSEPPLDGSQGLVFPEEMTGFVTAYGHTVDGETVQPDTLQFDLYIGNTLPRDPPCPSAGG